MYLILYHPMLLSKVIILLSLGCHATIDKKLLAVHFEYPGPAISERDLPICSPNAVCSVLHNRYWMSPIVKRLCRCLGRIECPWEWKNYPDNNTMHLDNRSQLKFCDDVSELPECGQKKPALTVTTTSTTEVRDSSTAATVEEEKKLGVNVSCNCPKSFIWEKQPLTDIMQNAENGTIVKTQYKCKPITRCTSLEFCGNVRADFFSTYYRCSCPQGHMCLNKNRTLLNASELLYDGQVYQAFCYPY